MAEEDLIFGKNRHLFGGIEPSNMKTFSVEIKDNIVRITAILPDDTTINGQTLCAIEGDKIIKNYNDYPQNEFDCELIAYIKMSTSFSDNAVSSDKTCYYAAFPYSKQGVYKRNKQNREVIKEVG